MFTSFQFEHRKRCNFRFPIYPWAKPVYVGRSFGSPPSSPDMQQRLALRSGTFPRRITQAFRLPWLLFPLSSLQLSRISHLPFKSSISRWANTVSDDSAWRTGTYACLHLSFFLFPACVTVALMFAETRRCFVRLFSGSEKVSKSPRNSFVFALVANVGLLKQQAPVAKGQRQQRLENP